MASEFVVATCDVKCRWDGLTTPTYRCYVNDELFAERTWIWHAEYLEESLQILADPGKYRVRYELVDGAGAVIQYSNLRIEQGPAVISPDGAVHIYTPKQ